MKSILILVVCWLVVGCNTKPIVDVRVSGPLAMHGTFAIEPRMYEPLREARLQRWSQRKINEFLAARHWSRSPDPPELTNVSGNQDVVSPIVANLKRVLAEGGARVVAERSDKTLIVTALSGKFYYLIPPDVAFIDVPGLGRRAAPSGGRGGGRRIEAVPPAGATASEADGAQRSSAFIHLLSLQVVHPDGRVTWSGAASRVDGREDFNLVAPLLMDAIFERMN